MDATAGHHKMLTEILEQPEIIQRQIGLLFENFQVHRKELAGILDHGRKEIYLVGCGSSFNAGLVAKHLMGRYGNTDVHVSVSSEFRLTDRQIERGGVVIAISQSGETADTISAIGYAKKHDFGIISVVNGEDSRMEKMSDYTFRLNAGTETAIASTKTYTAQIATLAFIAYSVMSLRNTVGDEERVIESYRNVGDALRTITDGKESIKTIARAVSKSNGLMFIGKGIDHATCREACLKMSEVNYKLASAVYADELRHGPIAMIDDTFTVIGIVSDRKYLDSVQYNLKLAKEQGAITVLVTPFATSADWDHTVLVPEIVGYLAPIASVIPIQLLVYYIGIELGRNIDSPRNLVKCVGKRE